MNSSTVTSCQSSCYMSAVRQLTSRLPLVFSRDVFLKRQARTRKRDATTKLCPSSSSTMCLEMIEEEDEPRLSSSRSPLPITQYTASVSPGGSQTVGVKSRRRHANLSVSDIRLARTGLVHDDGDISQHSSTLLSSPRPAPQPPKSRSPSPESTSDPFHSKVSSSSSKFSHRPIPTPLSMLSFEQSCDGYESPTPSMTSSSTSSPESRSTGLPTTPGSSDDEFSSYYSSPANPRRASIRPLIITKLNPTPRHSICRQDEPYSPPSPLASEWLETEETDSEWYTREFSQILTLCSPLPPNFPHKARPESIYVPVGAFSPALPTPACSSPTQGYPSAQLDPAFPRRNRASVPKYPPPPVPTISTTLTNAAPTPVTPPKSKTRPRSNTLYVTPPPLRRPPPRSSIPADCVLVDDTFTFADDTSSVFSLSLYDAPRTADSPTSFYSQASFRSPAPSPFPASFPSTPSAAEDVFDFPVDEVEFDIDLDRAMLLPLSLPSSPIDLEADIASGLEELRLCSPSDDDDATHGLRSRWSSSTLSSVREEHARYSGLAPKLLAYFGSPSTKTKTRAAGKRRSGIPMSPTSPSKRFRHARRESDVMVIGYGMDGQEYGKRGSVSDSVSDAESTGSEGLKRKPIPVTMFLKSNA